MGRNTSPVCRLLETRRCVRQNSKRRSERPGRAANQRQRVCRRWLSVKARCRAVGGRIDRIDVGQVDGRIVYTVIDYKTGRRSAGKVDSVQSGESCNWRCTPLAVARLENAGPAGRP